MKDKIDIYKYNHGDRIKIGTAKKDTIDGRYYMEDKNDFFKKSNNT